MVSEQTLRKMTASLAHRGPDAEGLHVSGPIGLGHRRLSILDLSERANQPMKILNGKIVITYNGQIYNFPELREELTRLGHTFFSNCDTEVVIRAYHQWGINCLQKLSGIFAFAIWDEQRQTLFLARDPLGIKPLFYAADERSFRFGSEVKAVLCDPRVSREFCDKGLDAYFTFSYCTAPLTGLQSVQQLLPGHYAIVSCSGIKQAQYWKIPYLDHPIDKPFREVVEEYNTIFDRVVERQLISDVPVGVFLSGGLDSTAIASAVSRTTSQQVTSFSVGFAESSFNELPFARQVARTLELDLIEDVLGFDAVELLPKISRFMDEPTADSSMIAVYLLSKMTSQHLKVVLSGDGADEILAGYETYRANQLAHYYRMVPSMARKFVMQPLARHIPVSNRKYNLHQFSNRFINGAEQGPGRDHCSWRIMFNTKMKDQLYTKDFRQRTYDLDPVGDYANCLKGPPESFGPLSAYLHADATFYLPNDMLVKVDRMGMANGLEVRVPFLDVDMVTFCANLPPEAKLHRGKVRKYILRKSLKGQFSDRFLNRKKAGFNIPVEHWMRKPRMRELLFDLIKHHREQFGAYLRIDEIETLWTEHAQQCADHGHILFTVLMFVLWCRNLRGNCDSSGSFLR